jgi:hypothetical protein
VIRRAATIIAGTAVTIVLAAATPGVSKTHQGQVPATGRFRGYAEIFVSWTGQRTLVVDISIAENGAVTGCIGDASLFRGQLTSDRGWLARRLGWKRDWVVTGDLEGPIVASDSVIRDGVMLALDWTGDRFVGGLNTTGSEFGGKERMKLSAGRMELVRVSRANNPNDVNAGSDVLLTHPTGESLCQA